MGIIQKDMRSDEVKKCIDSFSSTSQNWCTGRSELQLWLYRFHRHGKPPETAFFKQTHFPVSNFLQAQPFGWFWIIVTPSTQWTTNETTKRAVARQELTLKLQMLEVAEAELKSKHTVKSVFVKKGSVHFRSTPVQTLAMLAAQKKDCIDKMSELSKDLP
eukprot:g16860.t1